jgi:hypothetical protein
VHAPAILKWLETHNEKSCKIKANIEVCFACCLCEFAEYYGQDIADSEDYSRSKTIRLNGAADTMTRTIRVLAFIAARARLRPSPYDIYWGTGTLLLPSLRYSKVRVPLIPVDNHAIESVIPTQVDRIAPLDELKLKKDGLIY